MSKENFQASEVARTCFCLQAQRAARVMARRYDRALQSVGITSGQFSLLMQLHRSAPVGVAELSDALRMDRTTLTAALKPLKRQGLIEVSAAPEDLRARLISLTRSGWPVLRKALKVWSALQAGITAELTDVDLPRFRADLESLVKTGA